MARGKEAQVRSAELRAVAEVIAFAIAREKASAAYYERALSRAGSEDARKIYAILIELDNEHENRLRSELARIKKGMAVSNSDDRR